MVVLEPSGACSLHAGPPSLGSQVRPGEGPRGQEGGRKEGQGPPTPAQEREETERTWLPQPAPFAACQPPCPPTSATLSLGQPVRPLLWQKGQTGSCRPGPGGAQAETPCSPPSAQPQVAGRVSTMAPYYGQAGAGPEGATEGGHHQREEGSGGRADRRGEARLGLPPGLDPQTLSCP